MAIPKTIQEERLRLSPFETVRLARGTTMSAVEAKFRFAPEGTAFIGAASGTLAATGCATGIGATEGGNIGRGGVGGAIALDDGAFGVFMLGVILGGVAVFTVGDGRMAASGPGANWNTVPHLGHTNCDAPLTALGGKV